MRFLRLLTSNPVFKALAAVLVMAYITVLNGRLNSLQSQITQHHGDSDIELDHMLEGASHIETSTNGGLYGFSDIRKFLPLKMPHTVLPDVVLPDVTGVSSQN